MGFYFFKAGAAETGADALAAALGSDTCDMTGMDDKVKTYRTTNVEQGKTTEL